MRNKMFLQGTRWPLRAIILSCRRTSGSTWSPCLLSAWWGHLPHPPLLHNGETANPSSKVSAWVDVCWLQVQQFQSAMHFFPPPGQRTGSLIVPMSKPMSMLAKQRIRTGSLATISTDSVNRGANKPINLDRIRDEPQAAEACEGKTTWHQMNRGFCMFVFHLVFHTQLTVTVTNSEYSLPIP